MAIGPLKVFLVWQGSNLLWREDGLVTTKVIKTFHMDSLWFGVQSDLQSNWKADKK